MSIRLKKEDFLKKEKLEVPETLKEELVNDEYDLDSFGDAFIMMPKMEEDKRQQNLEKEHQKKSGSRISRTSFYYNIVNKIKKKTLVRSPRSSFMFEKAFL